MKTKLTLRLDSELIEKTKIVAAERNTSLSLMVAEYFRSLQDNYQEHTSIETSVLKEISGVMSLKQYNGNPADKHKKKIREKYL